MCTILILTHYISILYDLEFPGRRHGNPFPFSCLENSHGQRSLVGYSPQGCKESDMTEVTAYTHDLEFIVAHILDRRKLRY